jgi:choline dehydrogenase-like flavoprotein
MLKAVKKTREIMNAKAFDKYRIKELFTADAKSDQEIIEMIRNRADTIYHPVGTCKMGPVNDPMSVVDEKLQVKGIKGLRVVDCSIMPTLIGGNTNAPAIMIAEKAADMIKASHAKSVPQKPTISPTNQP